MANMSALDMVNPYMSERRQFVCRSLAEVLPNDMDKLVSNSKATGAKFTEWTGHTQSSLETAWAGQGFTKQANGGWTRSGGGAVTTSCEGLIGKIFSKIEAAGLGKRKGGATSFNLAGNDQYGRESKNPPVGWHWYRDKTKDVRPQAGDLFQIGTPAGTRQWAHNHVGVITFWTDGENPMWETVEAGQGGPGSGLDFMMRRPYRPVNPIDANKPKKVIMGWLNIDEHFG